MKGDVFEIYWEGDDDRTEQITVDGRDYMFYEQESGESSLDLIASKSMESWYKAAAAAMRRQGRFDGTPEEFYEQVAFVLPVVGKTKQAPDPTTPPEESENSP